MVTALPNLFKFPFRLREHTVFPARDIIKNIFTQCEGLWLFVGHVFVAEENPVWRVDSAFNILPFEGLRSRILQQSEPMQGNTLNIGFKVTTLFSHLYLKYKWTLVVQVGPFKHRLTGIPPLTSCRTPTRLRAKHKLLTFYLQSWLFFFLFVFFFCHTESKNVATTLICATGSHTKNHGSLVAQLL